MLLNIPRNLLNRNFPEDEGVDVPRGRRLTARKLNRADSARVRGAMGRSGPVTLPSGRTANVRVRPLGRGKTKAKVKIPVKRGAWDRLKSAFRSGKKVAMRVPAGGGSRLVNFRSAL